MATEPVVVGVDGSEESLLAAEWAALEARRHGLPLRIVSTPAIVPHVQAYQLSPAVADALRAADLVVFQAQPERREGRLA